MTWDDVGRWIGTWDWGTFPDYLGAIGTVGAVGAALWIARRDGKRFEDEQAAAAQDRKAAAIERQEAAEDRARFRRLQDEQAEDWRRELAGQVSVTFDQVHLRDSRGNATDALRLNVTIVNHGPRPISHVQVYFGEVSYYASPLADLWTITPGEEVHWATDEREHIWDQPRLKVYFRDARGVHWIRDLAGYLWEHEDIGREPRPTA